MNGIWYVALVFGRCVVFSKENHSLRRSVLLRCGIVMNSQLLWFSAAAFVYNQVGVPRDSNESPREQTLFSIALWWWEAWRSEETQCEEFWLDHAHRGKDLDRPSYPQSNDKQSINAPGVSEDHWLAPQLWREHCARMYLWWSWLSFQRKRGPGRQNRRELHRFVSYRFCADLAKADWGHATMVDGENLP